MSQSPFSGRSDSDGNGPLNGYDTIPSHKALLAGGLIQTVIWMVRFTAYGWSQSPFSGRSDSDETRPQDFDVEVLVTKPF